MAGAAHTRYNGIEVSYDQRARKYEVYLPKRDEVLIHRSAEIFEDKPDPWGSLANWNPNSAGDLPALLQTALRGDDPAVRHVGRTTIRGIDVDQIRIERELRSPTRPPAPRSRSYATRR